MLAKIASAGISGIESYILEIEVDIGRGLPAVVTVGLPDAAVKESRDRVKAAIKNSALRFPTKKITINLAPADVKEVIGGSIAAVFVRWRRPGRTRRAGSVSLGGQFDEAGSALAATGMGAVL